MEIISREGKTITKYKTVKDAPTDATSAQKKGKRLGVMYETEDGQTILLQDKE